MDRRSFAYDLHCKESKGRAASAQVMAGLTSEGWPDCISGLILPCGNGADWNCHAQ
jgi:hypothetical protein